MREQDCKHEFKIDSIDKNGIFGLKKVAYTYCIKCGKIGMEENNQSPQIDVERKPMILPTPNTSGKVNLVTEDTNIKQELNKEVLKDYEKV
jgi:hypothetical protein